MDAILTAENPKTAEEVWKALPIRGNANLWGDEIYFSTPVSLNEEHGREEVEVGAIAYWPPGKAVCIFFGQTPRANMESHELQVPSTFSLRYLGIQQYSRKFAMVTK